MFLLPIPFLIALSASTCSAKSLISGYYSKKVASDNYHTWFFGLIQSIFLLVSLVIIFSVSGGVGKISAYSLLFGTVIGVADMFSLILAMKAFSIGPFSYTTVITSLGSVIPTLSGCFFNEKVTLVQYAGVILMIVCLFLSPQNSASDSEKKASFKWLITGICSAVCSGMVGLTQKIHQNSGYSDQRAALLIGAFCFSAVVSAVILVLKHREKSLNIVNKKAVWLLPTVSGLIYAFPHTINLFLSGRLPAIIVFPLVNLCPMILSMILGMIIFREKLTKKRWLGVAVGILSSILVSGII